MVTAPANPTTQTQAVTSAPVNQIQTIPPAAQVARGLEQMRPQLAMVLPKHITAERFERVVMTAVNQTPALASADRRSLFNSCTKCASDGLVPDGREAALVCFGNQVQYMPMTFGIIKKLRQSGEIASVSARIVYEKELSEGRFRFAIEDGAEKLSHEPMLMGDRGKPALAYATARFKDGTVQNEVMTVADIEKVRQVSRAKNSGPWTIWWDEMARKTVVRRLSKYLPLSAEDMRVFERDDETEFDALKAAALKAEPQSIASAAAMLGGPVDVDPVTHDADEVSEGEVIENDNHDQPAPEDAPKPSTFLLFDPRSGEVTSHNGKDWIAGFKKLQAICTEPFDLWDQTNVEAYQLVCAACLAAGNKKAKAELDAIGEQAVKLGIL